MAEYTLQFADRIDRTLEAAARARGVTKAELIRRAVVSYSYLMEEQAQGHRVSITDAAGTVLKDVELP